MRNVASSGVALLLCVAAIAFGCGGDGTGRAADVPADSGPRLDVPSDALAPDEAGPPEDATGRDVGGAAPDVAPDVAEDALSPPDLIDAVTPRDVVSVPADATPDLTDATPDAAELSEVPDAVADSPLEPAQFDPGVWGPHEVGMTSFQLFDVSRLRLVSVTVWYPAIPMGQPLATYLAVIPGRAYQWAPADRSGAPYPLVLFSHGFRGTAVQSITFTEYLASHGYVVAAMDHAGNTLTDFFSNDETVANVALERPRDVVYTYDQMALFAPPGEALLSGMIDLARVGVSGHSFGGYTTLVVAGGQVDVSGAQAACAAGDPSDIFCDYVGYWEAGTTVKLPSGSIPGLRAAVAFAPGGYSAFGDAGLATITVPTMIFGGTLDTTCPVDAETDRIYAGLPAPKAEVVIDDASHMSFTNICDIPLAQQFLADYCDVPGIIDQDEGFEVVNTLTAAFFDRHLKDQSEYLDRVSQDWIDGTCGCARVFRSW